MTIEIYSPHPPMRYTYLGFGHGEWFKDDIPKWNLLWLSEPKLDLYLNAQTNPVSLLDPHYCGTVVASLHDDVKHVWPGLRDLLSLPVHQFRAAFFKGPFHRLPAYDAYGHPWIDTIRMRLDGLGATEIQKAKSAASEVKAAKNVYQFPPKR